MKITCLVVLFACAYAYAGVPYYGKEIVEPIELRLPQIQLQSVTTGNRPHDTSNDALLSEELAVLDQRNVVADLIRDILEGFRTIVINGNDQLPPLDPLVLNSLGPFHYTAVGVRATAYLHNLRAEGLRWYVVDEVTFNALRLILGVHITLPRLDINSNYDATATILLLNHNAGGNLRIFINRLEVGIEARLGTNLLGGHLTLRELDIKIDIHDTLIRIDGIFGSAVINNFISSLVQSITQDVIQNQLQNISQILSEQLFDPVNEILKNFTLADILG